LESVNPFENDRTILPHLENGAKKLKATEENAKEHQNLHFLSYLLYSFRLLIKKI